MKKWTNAINEQKSNLKDVDVILGLTLVNPTLLDFVQYPQNRYMFPDHTFQNMLKHTNISFANKLNWKIPNMVNDIDFSVEKNWNKLISIRNRASQILNNQQEIKNITFNDSGLIVNGDDYMHKNAKTYSNRTIFDSLFGVDQARIYENEYLWNVLIKSWLKLVFIHAKPETLDVINNFIFENQIADVTLADYKKMSANDDYKYLGVFFPAAKKNFKKLTELLKYLFKNSQYWNKHRQMKSSWQEIKNNVLNKAILLPIFKQQVDSKHLKNGVLHYLADQFDLKEDEYTNIKTLKKLPTRNQLLNKNVNLAISFWNNKNFDFVYVIKCLEDDKELGSIEIEIGWPSGVPENRLSSKIKLNNLNLDNIIKSE